MLSVSHRIPLLSSPGILPSTVKRDLGQGYWLSDAVCESNVMVGLAHSNQTVSNAGVASGPITHGGGMKIVVRNNTVLW